MKTNYKSGQWSATGIRIYKSNGVRVPKSRWDLFTYEIELKIGSVPRVSTSLVIKDLSKGLENPLLLNPKIDDSYRYKHQLNRKTKSIWQRLKRKGRSKMKEFIVATIYIVFGSLVGLGYITLNLFGWVIAGLGVFIIIALALKASLQSKEEK